MGRYTTGNLTYHDDDIESEDGEGGCCHRCVCRVCPEEKRPRIKQCVRTGLLLSSVVVGVFLGLWLRTVPAFTDPVSRERHLMYLTFPAELVVRWTTMLALPLITTSLISSVPELDRHTSGKLGGTMFAYYMYTTIMAVAEGIMFVVLIKPGGRYEDQPSNSTPKTNDDVTTEQQVDAFLDMMRNVFPDNLVTTCFQMSKTVITHENVSRIDWSYSGLNSTEESPENITTVLVEKLSVGHYEGMNMLGLAMLSVTFGVALKAVGPSGCHLSKLIGTVFRALMKMLLFFMWTYPLVIALVVAESMIRLEDPSKTFISLLFYIVTVSAGLLTHVMFVLPISYVIITRKNPLRFMFGLSQAVLTGFGTSNSLATLPVTMDCVERNGVDSRVARLVLPLGATVNMDGTALYEAVAVLFVAQMRGITPAPIQIFIMSLIAVVVSIGAPAMGDGFVSMVIVFRSLGLDISDIFILMTVDFILSRLRTVTNLVGDAFCAGVVSHVCRGALHEIDIRHLYDNEPGPPVVSFTARKDTISAKRLSSQHTLTMENEDGEKLIITRL